MGSQTGRALGAQASRRHREKLSRARKKDVPFLASVQSVSGGSVYIKETGTEEVTWEQSISAITDAHLVAGMTVVVLPMGEDYIALGAINSSPDSILPGESDFDVASSSTASGSPTTSTSLIDGLTLSASVPNGTYKVVVDTSIIASHSASTAVTIAISLQGSDVASKNIACVNEAIPSTRIATSVRDNSVVVSGGSIDVKTRYCAASAGTVTARNPVINLRWKRIA